MTTTPNTIPVTLKWNKQAFQFDLEPAVGRDLKQQIQTLTNVPVDRQKVMVASKPKVWKGMLKDDEDLKVLLTERSSLQLTMMGSAQVLQEPATKTEFIEDMTDEQKHAVEEQEYQASLKEATGMIPALQVLPQHRKDDQHKAADEVREYNRLVHGLPQWQIEKLLEEQVDGEATKLTGRSVMTMGLELQRAYVNDLTVLQNGTLVSALQDGHVNLWKHGERFRDVIHKGSGSNNSPNGVESVLALKYPSNAMITDDMPAFCTAGRGNVQLWNSDADPILAVSSTPYPYASPTGLVQLASSNDNNLFLGMAARFHVTPPQQSNVARLAPQDEAGRQRLAHIQAQEAMVEQTMDRIRRSIQLWFHAGSGSPNALQSTMLVASAPVTALESWSSGGSTILAAGDAQGGMQLWKVMVNDGQVQVNKIQHFQLVSHDTPNSTNSAIVCLKYVPNSEDDRAGQLIASTKAISPTSPIAPVGVSSQLIQILVPQAVHVLKVKHDGAPSMEVQLTLNGHKDVVSCLLPLPNGDLITAGGKFDATMKVWSKSQLTQQGTVLADASTDNLCKDVGYVFALTVLDDYKTDEKNPNRKHFAVAAARYNVVKIII